MYLGNVEVSQSSCRQGRGCMQLKEPRHSSLQDLRFCCWASRKHLPVHGVSNLVHDAWATAEVCGGTPRWADQTCCLAMRLWSGRGSWFVYGGAAVLCILAAVLLGPGPQLHPRLSSIRSFTHSLLPYGRVREVAQQVDTASHICPFTRLHACEQWQRGCVLSC